MADGMGMRVSLIGALRNAADALDAFDQHLGTHAQSFAAAN